MKIKKECGSIYEGCYCGLKDGHVPEVHKCISEGCTFTWTDLDIKNNPDWYK